MMNPTRFATLIACSAALCACDKIAEKLHPRLRACRQPSIRTHRFCAQSRERARGLYQRVFEHRIAASPADDATMQYCGCVYDEGAKAYGDKAQWDSALAIDKPENMPEKLQKTVASVSDSCSQKILWRERGFGSFRRHCILARQSDIAAAASQPAAASTPAHAAGASAVAASDASAPAAATGKHSGGSKRRGHHRRRR